MSLSDNQLKSAHFDAAAAAANEALVTVARDLGVTVESLGSEGMLNNIVDKLTAMGIFARRKKTGVK